jgi:dienelactone hydrolase
MFERIEYECEGKPFRGVLASPPAGATARGGVLVFHGGGGLGVHERDRVRMLAALGFVAFAPDLFGEAFADRAAGLAAIRALAGDPDRLRGRTAAALRRLAACVDPGRIAAIGHCFGGLAALELARSGAELRATVSFHGGLATARPARPGEVRARVLACTGAADPYCPREQRAAFEDEMTAANVDWQHCIHAGALHGFTVVDIDPEKHPGCAYHALADRRSWLAMLGLLDEVIPRA